MRSIRSILLPGLAFALFVGPPATSSAQHLEGENCCLMQALYSVAAQWQLTQLAFRDLYLSEETGTVVPDSVEGGSFGTASFTTAAAETTGDLWRAEHDLEGNVYGMSLGMALPLLDYGVEFAIGYGQGEIDGDFQTTALEGTFAGQTFGGTVEYDRKVFDLLATIRFLEWLEARVAYQYQGDEGDWRYDDGDVEPQKYTLRALRVGVIPTWSFDLGESGLVLVLEGYVGVILFEHEHYEVLGQLTTTTEDQGFELGASATLEYPVSEFFTLFGGAGFHHVNIDDDAVDREKDIVAVTLGVQGWFQEDFFG